MKTTTVFVILVFCSFYIHAQIEVESNGYVGIGGVTHTTGLHLDEDTWLRFNSTSYTTDRKLGILFYEIHGSYPDDVQYGAKIYYNEHMDGLALVTCQNWVEMKGIFIERGTGDVGINDITPSYKLDVDGTIGAYEALLHSDARFKKDIAYIDEQNINNLYNLQAKTFKWDNLALEESEVPESPNDTVFTELDTTPTIGFIAQELIEYYPNLVKQDDEGYYSINYIALIPVLVEAVKNHQERIVYLEEEINQLKSTNSDLKSQPLDLNLPETPTNSSCILYQNTPNPFNQETKICCYISSDYTDAALYIYDMQGTQIKSYNIQERGNGSIIIYGSELNPGMYLYTLIVDGDEVDTKRMILTD